MMLDSVKISPLGDSALTLSFGNEISPELNNKVLQLDLLLNHSPFSGFTESVPTYSSISVFYDVVKVVRAFPAFDTAFEAASSAIASLVQTKSEDGKRTSREMIVPVDFDRKYAIDLDLAAEKCGLTIDKFKDIFTSTLYRVYFLGFLPGFAYMGEVDQRIALPRLSVPRKNVPKGSVAIAGKQAGIYPLDSPGGLEHYWKNRSAAF